MYPHLKPQFLLLAFMLHRKYFVYSNNIFFLCAGFGLERGKKNMIDRYVNKTLKIEYGLSSFLHDPQFEKELLCGIAN
jgi:hypothetical protein